MNNTKLLIFSSLLIIVIGLGFLFFGLKQTEMINKPALVVEGIKQEASQSGTLVTRVVDGDTIEIEGGEKVRLIGVNTPETVDPKKPVECYGKEASNETKKLLTNKKVILEADKEDKDHYGRLLRYVFLPLDNGQMLFIEDYLIREGFGKMLIIPPDGKKYEEQFTEAQNQARNEKRGLWGSC